MKRIIFIVIMLLAAAACFSSDTLSPGELGVSIDIPSVKIHEGDNFYMVVNIYNPTQETFYKTPLFVLLGVFSFESPWYLPPPPPPGPWGPNEVSYYVIDVPPGITQFEVLPPRIWKGGFDGIPAIFFAGMSDPNLTMLLGTEDWFNCYFY